MLWLWLPFPLTIYCFSHNLLEPLLSILTLGSVGCLLAFERTRSAGKLALAAVLMGAGVLVKGVFALFPLAFFACAWAARRCSFREAVRSTLLLSTMVAALLGVLMLAEGPRHNLVQ